MRRGLRQRVQPGPDPARDHEGEPREAEADTLREHHSKRRAEYEIAGKVESVSMQKQRGDAPPPGAGMDQRRVGHAGVPPVESEAPPSRDDVERDEDAGVNHRGGDAALDRLREVVAWPEALILAEVPVEFGAGPFRVLDAHEQDLVRAINRYRARDASRFEHEGVVLDRLAALRVRDCDPCGRRVVHVREILRQAVVRATLEAGTVPVGDDEATALIVLDRLKITDKPRAAVWISHAQLRIFLENRTLTLGVRTGHADDKRVSRRPLFFQMNFLHLNHGKGVWTWVADVYAVALLLLAVSGAVILRGPRGFEGRGKWLVLAGLVIPLVFLWWKT